MAIQTVALHHNQQSRNTEKEGLMEWTHQQAARDDVCTVVFKASG